jgi:CheY-like chemotaxis protein
MSPCRTGGNIPRMIPDDEPTAIPEPTPGTATDRAACGPKVLVLEEDAALREATRMLLKTDGYSVLMAASLPAALALARQEPGIEILLVDDHPPHGPSGVQAIASLREVIGSRLKALLLAPHPTSSLRSLEQDGRVCIAAGPIGADALLAKLQALCCS